MTEGRHHRRRNDDHTVDGIYVPPPREVPRPHTEPTDWPPPAAPSSVTPLSADPGSADPSTWAPVTPGGDPPAQPPEAPRPRDRARSPEWTERPAEDDEEDASAPVAKGGGGDRGGDHWLPPLYPREWPPLPQPEDRRVEIPSTRWAGPLEASAAPATHDAGERSAANAWWIAVGVIVVGLAVAAGVLVGLRLAARAGQHPSGAAGAGSGGRAALLTTVERAAAGIETGPSGGCGPVTVTS
ncbi:hypothetical protein ABT297_26870 [Dactylosporangium sp. NPDC000555]|uniref:hypothetical protein n=1 Tax=Dactylosporangium sp. NPDC000555 TaxID=3154260 RepID=UPI0033262D9C